MEALIPLLMIYAPLFALMFHVMRESTKWRNWAVLASAVLWPVTLAVILGAVMWDWLRDRK